MNQEYSQKNKKNNNSTILIIFLSILVLGGIGVTIYFVTKEKKVEQKKDTPQNSQATIQNLQKRLERIEQTLNKPENSNKIKLKTDAGVIKGKLDRLIKENNPKLETIKQLEQEIKQIGQELKLPEDPKPDNPKPDNPVPPQNPPTPPTPNPNPQPTPPSPTSPPTPGPAPAPSPQPNPSPTPSPQPSPDPNEEWNRKKPGLEANARQDFTSNLECKTGSVMFSVKDEELEKNWYDELKKATNEEELETIRKAGLKDINEIKLLAPKERLKLKDYFAFNLGFEVGLRHIDGYHNVRDLSTDDSLSTINDLNQAIKGNPKTTWQRKFITFVGDFNVKSKADGEKLDEWIKSKNRKIWIVIKKNHNPTQYKSEENNFYLRKGLPDYHEFSSRKEAINFLRKNDSYFKP